MNVEDIHKFTVSTLRQLLKDLGLLTTGNKATLRARLEEHLCRTSNREELSSAQSANTKRKIKDIEQLTKEGEPSMEPKKKRIRGNLLQAEAEPFRCEELATLLDEALSKYQETVALDGMVKALGAFDKGGISLKSGFEKYLPTSGDADFSVFAVHGLGGPTGPNLPPPPAPPAASPPTPAEVRAAYKYMANLGKAEHTWSKNITKALKYIGKLHEDCAPITQTNLNNAVNNALTAAMHPFMNTVKRMFNGTCAHLQVEIQPLVAEGPAGVVYAYAALNATNAVNQAAPLGNAPPACFPRTLGALKSLSNGDCNLLLHFYGLDDPTNPGMQFPAGLGHTDEKRLRIAGYLGISLA